MLARRLVAGAAGRGWIVFLLLLSTLLLPAVAQDSPAPAVVKGRVVDENGGGVAGATVSVVDLRRSAVSDAEGRFEFRDLTPGEHLLEAFSPASGGGVVRVDLSAGETTEVDLTLELSHVRDHVVVTAAGDARSQLELAQATGVLSGDALALRLQPSLGETLAQEPGVASTSFAPGASRPVIRGLGGDRVRMLQDGLGAGDASSTSADHAVTIDPLTADRIEILRGPSTLLYGSSAIGGVVNVLDGRIPETTSSQLVSGFAEVRGGSAADERAAAVNLGGGKGLWAWHADALVRDTGDFDIPGFAESADLRAAEAEEGEEHEEEAFGVLPNSDLESASGSVGLSRFFGGGSFFGVSASGFNTEYGLPGGHGHGEEAIRIDMERRRIDLRGEVLAALGPFRALKVRLGAVDYEHQELEGPEIGTTFFNDSWEGRFELIQDRRGSLTGSVGAQVSRQELEAIGEEAFLPPTETTGVALFAFEEIQRGQLRYQLGARYENQDVSTTGPGLPDRSFRGLSGSLGLVWQPRPDYSVGVSVARSVKAPNGQELYSNGLHVATSSFEVGDASLDEESSLGLDVSLRKQSGRFTGELSLFYNRFDDFIFQAFTGEEEEGFPVVAYSQRDADFMGAELKARVGLVESGEHHLDLELSGDTVRAELRGGGGPAGSADEPLPRIPPLRLGAGLHYHGDRLQGLVEVRRVAEQDRVAANETPTDGYTLLNLAVGYRFYLGARALDLMLRGTNLTDEEARNHVSFVKDTVPLPGRDLGLSVRLWF